MLSQLPLIQIQNTPHGSFGLYKLSGKNDMVTELENLINGFIFDTTLFANDQFMVLNRPTVVLMYSNEGTFIIVPVTMTRDKFIRVIQSFGDVNEQSIDMSLYYNNIDFGMLRRSMTRRKARYNLPEDLKPFMSGHLDKQNDTEMSYQEYVNLGGSTDYKSMTIKDISLIEKTFFNQDVGIEVLGYDGELVRRNNLRYQIHIIDYGNMYWYDGCS